MNDQQHAAALLEVCDVHKQFDGLVVTDGCSFAVQPGTITGLIGPNGAGKSTLFNLVTGVYRADRGRIRFRGDVISGSTPNAIAAAGLGRTFQTPRLFAHMTVWENLMVAAPSASSLTAALCRRGRMRETQREISARAHEILAFLKLTRLTNDTADSLSGGQRKLLSLGRVLMMDPQLILLDEPVAGVNESLGAELFVHIGTLNRRGITFLIIEHDMDL